MALPRKGARRIVVDAIRTALAYGWSPGRAGRPFLLDRSAGFAPAP
ncbi:hypothetical protein ACFV4N_09570 [Actinosynnema sp. NPDC059797]